VGKAFEQNQMAKHSDTENMIALQKDISKRLCCSNTFEFAHVLLHQTATIAKCPNCFATFSKHLPTPIVCEV
jgi:hypothetical protein